jgi:molybdenum cofactor guanylyltransferase
VTVISRTAIVGCILAGGQSRRMGGGDKALRPIGGQAMLARVIDRLAPQVGQIVLNANGDPDRFAAFGLPVVADTVEGYAGPLAGVLAGMQWANAQAADVTHIASAASDTPFFPADLVKRLVEAAQDDDTIVLATSDGNRHPVFGLWPIGLADDLAAWMHTTETYKVLAWVGRHRLATVDFPLETIAGHVVDPFFNANTPEDLAMAERYLGGSAT